MGVHGSGLGSARRQNATASLVTSLHNICDSDDVVACCQRFQYIRLDGKYRQLLSILGGSQSKTVICITERQPTHKPWRYICMSMTQFQCITWDHHVIDAKDKYVMSTSCLAFNTSASHVYTHCALPHALFTSVWNSFQTTGHRLGIPQKISNS